MNQQSVYDMSHIVPHGGAKHLYPENTIFSFEMMHSRGWNSFEIDLTLTGDGILVPHHDLSIERTTGVEGVKIRQLTYEELRSNNFARNFVSPDGTRPYAEIEALDPDFQKKLVPAYDPQTDTMYTNLANHRMIHDSHRKNLAVYFWTVNTPKEVAEINIDISAES